MRFIATEFNLTIFKSYALKRKNFAWRNFFCEFKEFSLVENAQQH